MHRPGNMNEQYPAPEYSAPMGPPPSQQQQQYQYEIPQQNTGNGGAVDKAKNIAGKALGFLKRK